MKRMTQIITLFTVMTLTATLFAGCGSPNNPTAVTSASASTESAIEYKKPVELSVALWSIGEALVDGQDEIRDTIYKKFNVTLKPMNITWSDYKNKVMVWAASSQLPDMFAYDAVGTSTYKDWAAQGIIKAIPEDLSKYPNVKRLLDDKNSEVYKYPAKSENARFYAIPRLNHQNADDWSCDNGIQIRKDWMENVGVTKDPDTMDEFIDLMVKFVKDDPDRDGKNDTIGLTCYNALYLRALIMPFEPNYEGWTKDPRNPDKWIPGFMTENFLKAMKALNKLYKAGGLDKDFAILKGEEGEDKLANGIAGAYSHDVTPATLYYLAGKYEKVNPGKKYEDVIKILHPIRSEDGKYYRNISDPYWSETYFNADIDDTKVDRGLALLDYFLSEEGYNLIHYGIEGKDFTKDSSGNVTLIPQKDASGRDVAIGARYPFTKVGFFAEWSGTRQWTGASPYPALQKMSKEQHDWLMANAVPKVSDLRIGYLDTPSSSDAVVQLVDIIVKCTLSKDVEKTMQSEIDALKGNGFDLTIDETNAAITKAGIK